MDTRWAERTDEKVVTWSDFQRSAYNVRKQAGDAMYTQFMCFGWTEPQGVPIFFWRGVSEEGTVIIPKGATRVWWEIIDETSD